MSASATQILGVVQQLDEEWVETEFNVVAHFPTTPLKSYYRRGEDQRYEIPNHPLSVLKVYLSYHTGVAAFLCLGAGVLQPPATALADALLFLGAVLILLCAFGRFRLGRLTDSERKRRLVHRQVTGINALPSLLPERLVKNLFSALETKWKKSWKRWGAPKDWRQAVDAERDTESLAFLAVLTALDHALEPDGARAALSDKAWKLLDAAGGLEACGGEALESLSPDQAMAVMDTDQDEAPAPRAKPDAADAVAKAKRARVGREKKASRGIKIRCERCENVARVPETCAGHTGLCPSCNKPIRVPSKQSLRVAKRAAA